MSHQLNLEVLMLAGKTYVSRYAAKSTIFMKCVVL